MAGIVVNHGFPRTYLHSVEIHNNRVEDFGKVGIECGHPGLTVNVHHNIVIGQGPTSLNAQNGIQISYGATGTVAHNYVSNISYTSPGWAASGILAVASSGIVSIDTNTLVNT